MYQKCHLVKKLIIDELLFKWYISTEHSTFTNTSCIFNPPSADGELTRTESELCGNLKEILTISVFMTR